MFGHWIVYDSNTLDNRKSFRNEKKSDRNVSELSETRVDKLAQKSDNERSIAGAENLKS